MFRVIFYLSLYYMVSLNLEIVQPHAYYREVMNICILTNDIKVITNDSGKDKWFNKK